MKKNILLVYPEIPVTYWSFRHSLSFVGKKSLMPPLGLLTVAAMMPMEYELRLVDMNVRDLSDDDLRWADMVMLSAMIVQKESFVRVVERVKSFDVCIVAGGPYPTSSHESIDGIDHFLLGEGETIIPEFVRDYEQGVARRVYQSNERPDITKTPLPRYDLIDTRDYGSMALQYSRGCPFNCEFCDIIEMFGRVPRTKTVNQFIGELDLVLSLGYRGSLFIVDDNFIGNKSHVRDLLRALVVWQEEHDHPFTFFTEASVDLAGENEMLDLMAASGFNMVFLGIETPDTTTLSATKKSQNVRRDLLESVRIIQKKGIEVLAGFIVGFDTDTDDIFDRQIEFIQKAGIPVAMVGLMLALPGTQLYRRLEREGRIISECNGDNTNSLELNFVPVMSREKLVAGYQKVIGTLYDPEPYFERSLVLLDRMPKKQVKGRHLTKSDIYALFKSLIVQGFSAYGKKYFSFLWKAFRKNRANLPAAVNLAVKGHHFFIITKATLEAGSLSAYGMSLIEAFEKDLRHSRRQPAYVYDAAFRMKQEIAKRYRHIQRSVRQYAQREYEMLCSRLDACVLSYASGV
jgi:radical SAM superfamily enzyme YgiQ (UPF0313 family)